MTVMLWHPETGEMGVFAAADDAPKSWLDHHPGTAQPVAEETNDDRLSRDEVIAALQAGGIEFSKNARTASLEKQLRAALADELGVNVTDPRATRDLLGAVMGG